MLMHPVGSFTSRGQWLEASVLQPLIECYWKIACLWHAIFRGTPGNLRAASLRSLLTSDLLFGVSWCLSTRKKVSVLPLSVCSFNDQSSQLILCLDRMYIFLNLDCPASVWLSSLGLRPRLDNYQTLAGQSRSWKMKILSQQRNFAIELCHLWAVLQMQHRTFIP